MPRHEEFRRFGLLTVESFLDHAACASLCAEALSAGVQEARISTPEGEWKVDERFRRSKTARISAQTLSFLEHRIEELRPRIEEHFGIALSGCSDTHLLVYSEGDFFRYHRDALEGASQPAGVRERSVSIVMFLNEQAASPRAGCFCGGSLVLYGLLGSPQSEHYGMPLVAEEGLLVAFPSDTPHRVEQVTHGPRCTVVSWLLSSQRARLRFVPPPDRS